MARPRKPLLNRDLIRDTALELIDEDGLAELSMRRLGARLNVQAPSLYSHYANKDELLDDIANKIMESVDVSGFASEGWRGGLISWARSYRAALAAHPNFVPFLAYGPSKRDVSLAHADAVHGGLIGAGWPPRVATMIGASTKYIVVGAAMSSFAAGFVDDVQVYYDRYPNLVQAHRLREHADKIDHDSFELALASFLVGLDAKFAALST